MRCAGRFRDFCGTFDPRSRQRAGTVHGVQRRENEVSRKKKNSEPSSSGGLGTGDMRPVRKKIKISRPGENSSWRNHSAKLRRSRFRELRLGRPKGWSCPWPARVQELESAAWLGCSKPLPQKADKSRQIPTVASWSSEKRKVSTRQKATYPGNRSDKSRQVPTNPDTRRRSEIPVSSVSVSSGPYLAIRAQKCPNRPTTGRVHLVWESPSDENPQKSTQKYSNRLTAGWRAHRFGRAYQRRRRKHTHPKR